MSDEIEEVSYDQYVEATWVLKKSIAHDAGTTEEDVERAQRIIDRYHRQQREKEERARRK